MCGIFGYVGTRTDAGAIVIDGLKNLEYRGYDSWGTAFKYDSTIGVAKDIGKISEVDAKAITKGSSLASVCNRK